MWPTLVLGWGELRVDMVQRDIRIKSGRGIPIWWYRYPDGAFTVLTRNTFNTGPLPGSESEIPRLNVK